MADDSVLEKIARAIVRADEQNGGPPWEYIVSLGKHALNAKYDQARAAIEAHESALRDAGFVIVPREPTEAMVSAGNGVDGAPSFSDARGEPPDAEHIWHAMIDSILTPQDQ